MHITPRSAGWLFSLQDMAYPDSSQKRAIYEATGAALPQETFYHCVAPTSTHKTFGIQIGGAKTRPQTYRLSHRLNAFYNGRFAKEVYGCICITPASPIL